jgi:PD-(D/E)XK endonuclease
MNIGDMSEGAIFGALLRIGAAVLVPFGQNQPYDLVVDRGEAGFVRIQCKTGWQRNGCIEFNSSSTDHGHGHRHYRGRADLFAVFVPDFDQVFIVPVESAAGRRTYLRIRAAANNQARRVRRAEDHVLELYEDQLLPAPLLAV